MQEPGEDTVLAFCYLHRANDEENKCLLTAKKLVVIYRGRRHIFDLQHIKWIEFNERRLMLPLLTGGIFAPLSAVAIFEELYDPWWLLLILFSSLLLFYYGWQGQRVMTVTEAQRHRDFSIPLVSPNIRAFAGFVNELLSGKQQGSMKIYHVTGQKLWETGDSNYNHPSLKKEGFIHCAARGQLEEVVQLYFNGENELLLLVIDPLKVKSEIRYEDSHNNGRLYPHVYGPLNRDAVVKTIPFRPEEIPSLLASGW